MDTPTTYLVFSRQAVREMDHRAMEEFGIPGLVLMENAARGLAEFTLRFLRERGGGKGVLAVCGSGNNAGDALAAARHLHNAGVGITIALTRPADSLSPDAAVHLNVCRKMGLRIVDCSSDPVTELSKLAKADVILDGLLGTGLSSPVRSSLLAVIQWMNAQQTPIIAIDIPSGLDCDTGQPLGAAVRAATTVTFVGIKKGFLTPEARAYTGDVHIVDIGAPRELVVELSEGEVSPGLPLP